jgi:hypothetical protein
MEILVHSHNVVLPPHGSADIATRIRFLFGRLAAQVSRVHVTLKDINGPRGGRDKVCVIRAELSGGGQVVVQDRNVRMRRAIGRGLRRAKAMVSEQVRRRREQRRKPPRQTISATA